MTTSISAVPLEHRQSTINKGKIMDKVYFLARMDAELAAADMATNAVAKLIHLDMAGRYSVAAADQVNEPDRTYLAALGQRA